MESQVQIGEKVWVLRRVCQGLCSLGVDVGQVLSPELHHLRRSVEQLMPMRAQAVAIEMMQHVSRRLAHATARSRLWNNMGESHSPGAYSGSILIALAIEGVASRPYQIMRSS